MESQDFCELSDVSLFSTGSVEISFYVGPPAETYWMQTYIEYNKNNHISIFTTRRQRIDIRLHKAVFTVHGGR